MSNGQGQINAPSPKVTYAAYGLLLIVGVVVLFSFIRIAFATTPNPGHPWAEVGDGTFVVTGPTVSRTYTFPDANATILTSAAAVTVPQGGTGLVAATQGDIIYASAANTFSALAKNATASRYLSNSGASNNPAWAQVDLTNGVTGILPLANGGTAANLSASNGGIVYSGASTFAVLAGTATAGQILRSGASAAPTWSTATYPATAGTSGNVLQSDGTNFVSTAPSSVLSVTTFPISGLGTGALTALATNSLTSRNVGRFTVPGVITVNQLSFSVGTVTTAGTMKVCVYTGDGNTKNIDVTSGTVVAGTNSVTVSPAVTLPADTYYIAIGCATTCSDTVQTYTTTSLALLNGAVPAGKRVLEGTITATSGTCNTTLGTVTGVNSKQPVVRLDN